MLLQFGIRYLIFINLLAFLMYGLDKYKAIKEQWRISEATLILLAIAGGSVGALAGMYIFRHKTKKAKFYAGVPAILVLWIFAGILIYQMF